MLAFLNELNQRVQQGTAKPEGTARYCIGRKMLAFLNELSQRVQQGTAEPEGTARYW